MKEVTFVFIVVILTGSLALIGCDTNETATNDIQDISMMPESATIDVGETVDFSVVALTASGDTAEITNDDVRWWSTDTTVFKVENDGTVIGRNAGTAKCMVEVNTLSKAAAPSFVGRDSAFVTVLF